MNIITGYISSTSGTVTIDGKEILENPKEAKAKIGYLPEIPPLYTDMTVKKYLEFMFDLKRLNFLKKNTLKRLCDLFVLPNRQTELLKTYQKVIVSVSVLPRLCSAIRPCLFWTSRLSDLTLCRLSKSENLLKVLAKSNTIILSSHVLSEISATCDRILVISNGKIVAECKDDRAFVFYRRRRKTCACGRGCRFGYYLCNQKTFLRLFV